MRARKIAYVAVLLFSAMPPVLAQRGVGSLPGADMAKPMPTPMQIFYDPTRDPMRNGAANSAPTPAVAIPAKAGETVSITTLTAPPEARAAYEKGVQAYNKHKVPDAKKDFEKAVGIYPKFAVAWYSLGVCLWLQSNSPDAAAAYQRALDADPKYPDPYARLAAIELEAGKWQDAADTSERLIRLDPAHFPEAYLYDSVADLRLSKFREAEHSARDALSMDTGHKYPKAEQVLGLALANENNFAEARTHFIAYLGQEKNTAELARARQQLAIIDQEAATSADHPVPARNAPSVQPDAASAALPASEKAEIEETQQ